jgi:hypothetical protein
LLPRTCRRRCVWRLSQRSWEKTRCHPCRRRRWQLMAVHSLQLGFSPMILE